MMNTFSDLLEEFRSQKHISKKDLAHKAGLTPGYVSLLTHGERKAPSRKIVEALADALELDEEAKSRFFKAAGFPDVSYPPVASSLPEEQEKHPAKVDWGGAPATDIFCGRQEELTLLKQWIEDDGCRIVAVLGLGGIGKTSLTTKLARSIYTSFDYVFWRSLQDAPLLEDILRECLQFLTDQKSPPLPREKDSWLPFLMTSLLEAMRSRRCLIILDNFEAVFQQETRTGQYREGYEGYARFIQLIGSSTHQSCLLLTSREKPKEIVQLEGAGTPVRSQSLPGMTIEDCQDLLKNEGISGPNEAWISLINLYFGNPLALKLIAESIRELFDGSIAEFLKQDSIIVGDMSGILQQQFERLPEFEKEIMYWLAIERQPVLLTELQRNMLRPVYERVLVEALNSLRRRSIIETVGIGRFTLQPVVMEYVTELFVHKICQEIDAQEPHLFESHALLKAQAKDYVRERQTRLILDPIAKHLLITYRIEGTETRLKRLLEQLRQAHSQMLSYVAGNIIDLLVYLQVDLSSYDFSHLIVWQAYLQGVTLHGVNFSHADLAGSVFTDSFDSVLSVAVSADGKILAAGTADSEVRLWGSDDGVPLGAFKGHHDWVRSISIDHNSSLLASASEDQTIRLWDMNTQQCLAVLRGHKGRVYAVAFSPDGKYLASGGEDRTVRFWDVASGQCLKVCHEHTNRVWAVSFSPDSTLVASNSEDQTIRLWDVATGQCLRVLEGGHTSRIWSVTFSPDGRMLASGGEDCTVRLWDVQSGQHLSVLPGHTDWVRSVAFSPDGKILASSSDDTTVRLWAVDKGVCIRTLDGHENRVRSIAFSPDSKILVTGGDDQTINQWEVDRGRLLRKLHGNITRTWCVAFSPDQTLLASTNEDRAVRIWDINKGECLRVLYESTNWARSVAFSPDGKLLASGGEDRMIRLWDVPTGQLLDTLQGHTSWIYAVAFDPTGTKLASCGEDQTVRLWDVKTRQSTILQNHFDWVRSVAFSANGEIVVTGGEDQVVRLWNVHTGECILSCDGHEDGICSVAINSSGTLVASGSEDHSVKIWDTSTGRCLHTLQGHSYFVRSVAFSPDGTVLASGGDDGVVYLWDVRTGTALKALRGHVERVSSVAFSPDGTMLASGGYDGTIRLWWVSDGQLLRKLTRKRPYEGMNVASVRGLTLAQKSALRDLGAVEIQEPFL
jgi:WD40 repeat protein/transcriptional regulator with XRE-family HTH domain